MATIDRRTIAELVTEHVQRMGKMNDRTAYDPRAKEFVNAAVRHCAQTWHHPELDKSVDTLTLPTSGVTLDISSVDPVPLIIGSFQLRDSDGGGTFLRNLVPRNLQRLLAELNETAGEPAFYQRWGVSDILLNKVPNKAYKSRIYYYAKIADFDDTTGNLELEQQWDEICLVLSVALANQAIWSNERAASHFSLFERLIENVSNPLLREVYQFEEPVEGRSLRPHAGGLGG